MMPYNLVMCLLNFSEGHHYANGGVTSAVPLLLTQTFVPLDRLGFAKLRLLTLCPNRMPYNLGNQR